MAQPIRCDAPDCEDLGRILVTDIDSGDVTAFCGGHFALFCAGIAIESGLAVQAQQAGDAAGDQAAGGGGSGGAGKRKKANAKAAGAAETLHPDSPDTGA